MVLNVSCPDLQDTAVTGWRPERKKKKKKAFKRKGSEIDEITYVDERNGVRVVSFKGSSMH